MCSFNCCHLQNYENESECILHCNKVGYYDSNGLTQGGDFFNPFILHIIERLFLHKKTIKLKTLNKVFVTPLELQQVLCQYYDFRCREVSFGRQEKAILEDLRRHRLVLNGIKFPPRDERDPWDYLQVLSLFESIEFRDCTFRDSYLELHNTAVMFDKTHFLENITVYDYPFFIGAEYLPIYRDCTFHDDVNIYGTSDQEPEFKRNIFGNCQFKKALTIEFASLEGKLFNDNRSSKIESLIINQCTFKQKFKLNHYQIVSVSMSDSLFKGKFEFKHSNINEFSQVNCNFEKVADFFESTFDSFVMEKSVFEQFAALEDTVFGIPEKPKDKPAIFKYVTFKDFSNFRGATFNDGIDVEKANFIQPPNLLGATVPLRNTPRETFRIIKHSFDDVGNYIEANKYFALEMEKRGKEVEGVDRFIYSFNWLFSNFGQSYLRPLFALLLVSLFATITYLDNFGNWPLWFVEPDFDYQLSWHYTKLVFIYLNEFADTFFFSSLLKEGYEFISLVYGILMSIFTWMTIVALKRLSKR